VNKMNDISGMTTDEKERQKYTATNYVQTTPFTEQDYMDYITKLKDKIQQLEKENAELKHDINLDLDLYDKEAKKNLDLQLQLSTLKQQLADRDNTITEQKIACQEFADEYKGMKEQIENKDKEIATLSNDVNMLDRGLHEHKSRHEQNWTNVFNQLVKDKERLAKEYEKLAQENALLEFKLENQPKLNRAEVEGIIKKYNGFTDSNYKTQYLPHSKCEIIIDAICNLAYNRDKIIEVLIKEIEKQHKNLMIGIKESSECGERKIGMYSGANAFLERLENTFKNEESLLEIIETLKGDK